MGKLRVSAKLDISTEVILTQGYQTGKESRQF